MWIRTTKKKELSEKRRLRSSFQGKNELLKGEFKKMR